MGRLFYGRFSGKSHSNKSRATETLCKVCMYTVEITMPGNANGLWDAIRPGAIPQFRDGSGLQREYSAVKCHAERFIRQQIGGAAHGFRASSFQWYRWLQR